MAQDYVEVREGAYYVANSRISLASIVYAFRDGASPETIRENFPSLSLAQVYGGIAFYLNHPEESEAYLQDFEEEVGATGTRRTTTHGGNAEEVRRSSAAPVCRTIMIGRLLADADPRAGRRKPQSPTSQTRDMPKVARAVSPALRIISQ